MRVLVAIPVYNEERHVSRVLSQVLRLTDDVLVVDDGSTDATPEILGFFRHIAIVRHEYNLGYGRSLIDAFRHAENRKYDWVLTMDCDDQHEPARIPAFIERAEQDDADIVSGSRYLADLPGNTAAPPDRRKINGLITKLLNETLGLSLTDSFCGFKAHRVEAIAKMRLTESGYAFPLQFWVQAVRLGLRVTELPVQLIYNDPKRAFGGQLDDPDVRLRHYVQVFWAEMGRSALASCAPPGVVAPVPAGGR